MLTPITNILKEQHILSHLNQGITVASVADASNGILLAQRILEDIVDAKTVLYLSGGSTPKVLYEHLAREKRLKAGAIGLIDERYGEPMHDNSNEKMIRETGLLTYATTNGIPLHLPLQGASREETAEAYDQELRQLNATFQTSVGILGIGNDGHTAGLPAMNSKLTRLPSSARSNGGQEIQNAKPFTTYDLFTSYHDQTGPYGERVTMTFVGLQMLDVFLVLVFGKSKQHALEQVFEEGSEEEIPARFFTRPDIAKKTLFITDQRI